MSADDLRKARLVLSEDTDHFCDLMFAHFEDCEDQDDFEVAAYARKTWSTALSDVEAPYDCGSAIDGIVTAACATAHRNALKAAAEMLGVNLNGFNSLVWCWIERRDEASRIEPSLLRELAEEDERDFRKSVDETNGVYYAQQGATALFGAK